MKPSYSLEITNIEWSFLKDIEVTLYNPNAGRYDKASCTAFYKPENNKPIGGESSFFDSGIATVRIDVPGSYERKNLNDFEIKCK